MNIAGKFLPAFTRNTDGSFVPTPEWQTVQDIMQQNTDIPINIQPAPSVMAGIDGQGIWGSGGGLYRPDFSDAYVDPIRGSVTTAAHEAAHQSFPSQLINDQKARKKSMESLMTDFTKSLINDGTAMRVGYEALSKPIMLEEANAQGVVTAAMNAAGLKPNTGGWQNMLSYPGEYRFGGQFDRAAPLYKEGFNKPGIATLLPGELNTLDTMFKSYPYAMQRQFNKGYGMIK
jgi:hypothetical protein